MKAVLRRLEKDVGELVEARTASGTETDFSRYEGDPVGFIRDILAVTDPGLWAGQVEICASFTQHPLTVVRSNNGAGKDFVAALLALYAVYVLRALVLITGPTDRQVREVCMGEVRRGFHRGKNLPGQLFQMALRIEDAEDDNVRGILAFTSTEASRLTGFHAPRVVVIVTEGQGVEDYAYEGLLACATGDQDRVLVLGNPTTPVGKFYDISQSRSWSSIRLQADEHPNVQTGRTVIPGAVTRAFVSRIAEEYGTDSPQYRSRVLGEFPEQSDEALVSRRWLDDAVSRWRERRDHDHDPELEETITLGVDPARLGPDRTAVCVRRGRTVIRFLQWQGLDTQETASRVGSLVEEVMAQDGIVTLVVVDEVGLGAGVLDRLRQTLPRIRWHRIIDRDTTPRFVEGGVQCDGFSAGSKSGEPSRFGNLRAQGFWVLREMLEDGALDLPPEPDLVEELLHTRVVFGADGRTQVEPKDKLKSRLGRSPDLADALVISLAPLLATQETEAWAYF